MEEWNAALSSLEGGSLTGLGLSVGLKVALLGKDFLTSLRCLVDSACCPMFHPQEGMFSWKSEGLGGIEHEKSRSLPCSHMSAPRGSPDARDGNGFHLLKDQEQGDGKVRHLGHFAQNFCSGS